MSLIGCGSIHQGHKRFSDDSRGRQEIFMCLAALLYEQFLPIREWRCQDIDQVLLHGDFFLSSELLSQVSHDHRSHERNLSNCALKPEEVRTSTGFELLTSRYRCDALTN